MNCKEAIETLKKNRPNGTRECDEELRKAVDLAVVALELQDGNLYMDDMPSGVHIGTVNGNMCCN